MDEASIEQPPGHSRRRRHDSKPLHGASEQDRARLGVLLQRRRSELGYPGMGLSRFARERDVNWRGITDIEKANRASFLIATLDEYARAYEVTYESLVAVGRGEADELVAAPGGDELADDPSGEILQELSIERARATLGDLIDRARYTGDPTLITRNGKPAALITPVLHRHDRAAITQIRQEISGRSALADPLVAMIGELLLILDRYFAADKNLDASQEHDAGSKP